MPEADGAPGMAGIARPTLLRTNLAGGDARPTDLFMPYGWPQVHKQAGRRKKRADTQVRPYGKANLFWSDCCHLYNHPK
jgi:hypothetical protein